MKKVIFVGLETLEIMKLNGVCDTEQNNTNNNSGDNNHNNNDNTNNGK